MDWLVRPQAVVEEAPRSKWFVIAAGFVPLLGVLALGWDLGLVMVAFWLENIVVGFYSVLRMAVALRWGALFMVPFFTFHYGMFTFVHGIFVVMLFVVGPTIGSGEAAILDALRALGAPLLVVLGSLMVSHGYSFAVNFLRPRRASKRKSPSTDPVAEARAPVMNEAKTIMGAAYKRVVILHLVLVLGSFPMLLLGQPVWGLVLLVLLKVVADVWSHAREHRKPLQTDTPVATT